MQCKFAVEVGPLFNGVVLFSSLHLNFVHGLGPLAILSQCYSPPVIFLQTVVEHNPPFVASTDNFSTLIGKGGFGSIYKGELNDITVAVKVLDKVYCGWCLVST